MACYTEVRLPKSLPWAKIEKYIHQVLTEKFGNTYTIDTGGNIEIRFEETEVWSPHVTYYIATNRKKIRKLQWSDNSFRQLDGGWFSNWLSCKIAKHFKGMIYSESLGQKYKPTFHEEHPNMLSWFKEKNNNSFLTKYMQKRIFLSYTRQLKKLLPEQVYKVFAEK